MPGVSNTDVSRASDTKRGGAVKPVTKSWKKKSGKKNKFTEGK